jgi:hypothetical protein
VLAFSEEASTFESVALLAGAFAGEKPGDWANVDAAVWKDSAMQHAALTKRSRKFRVVSVAIVIGGTKVGASAGR